MRARREPAPQRVVGASVEPGERLPLVEQLRAAGWRRCASRCPRRASRPRRRSAPCRPVASSSFCGALGAALPRAAARSPGRARRAGPSSPARSPTAWASTTWARDLLDRLGGLVRATARRRWTRCSSRSTSNGQRVVPPGEEGQRLLGRPLGVLADRALAVGGAHVDGAVLGDPAPLARRHGDPLVAGVRSARSRSPTARHCGPVSGALRSHRQSGASPATVGWHRSDHAGATGVRRRADRRLPRRSVGHQLLRRRHRPGRGVRGRRPRQGRRRRRRRGGPRAPAQAGRGAAHPRPHRPHVVRRAGRRHLRRHRLDPPAPTGTCSPTRWPACRAETAAMLLGGKLRVRRARRRRASSPTAQTLELAGLELRRRPHPGPHRGLGDVPHAVRRARTSPR